MESLTQLLLGSGIIIAVYAYMTISKFRYYTKFAFISVSAWFCASAFIPLMLLRPWHHRNALFPAWSHRFLVNLFLRLKWEIRGTENILRDTGSVVLMNHQSMLDLNIFGEIWHLLGRSSVIAKRELFYVWPFGLATWLWGTIFIDRLNSESARNTVNKTANTIKTKQLNLIMFPEGTRHGENDLLRFKKGAFHVAIASQCPIQPILLSKYYFIDHRRYIFDSGRVIVNILPPIPTAGLTRDDIDTLMSDVYEVMNNEYHRLTKIAMGESS